MSMFNEEERKRAERTEAKMRAKFANTDVDFDKITSLAGDIAMDANKRIVEYSEMIAAYNIEENEKVRLIVSLLYAVGAAMAMEGVGYVKKVAEMNLAHSSPGMVDEAGDVMIAKIKAEISTTENIMEAAKGR